jgi:DNA-binding NarL/FixJ family response regulator
MKCSVLSGNKEIFIDLEKPFGRDLKYSARELEILKLIDQGLQNKQIADKLKISWFTVSNHRKNIMNKTEGHSIPQAINFAKAKGLI